MGATVMAISTTKTCPKCGLVQMSRPTCKSCGASLTASARPVKTLTATPTATDESRGSWRDWIPASEHRGLLVLLFLGVAFMCAVGYIFHAATYPPTGRPSASSPSSARQGPPRPSPLHRQAAKDALDALQALQSATRVGLAYGDYTPRLLDTTVRVDRYLRESGAFTQPGDEQLRTHVHAAMDLYALAGKVWNNKITGQVPWVEIATHSAIESCEPLRAQRDATPLGTEYRYEQQSHVVGKNIALVWACASDRIANAQALLQ